MPEERTPGDKRSVTFRPVRQEDEAFLLDVYSSTRQEELARVPWNEAQREAFLKMQFAAQQYHYRKHYPDAAHEIILSKDRAVGRLYVSREEQEIHIIDITILPEHRDAGIGTPIIKDLMAEAEAAGKPLRIYVESFNRSLRLFERLGFTRIDDDGFNYLMEWSPPEKSSQ
jgi:ribosomal protein S18 acetylase RimI-like enzyme